MKIKSRTVAVGGLSAALAVIILLLASVMPAAEIGLAALAGVCVVPAILSGGRGFGLLVYVAVAALAMLLLPDKNTALMFTLFFGHYPLLKSICEQIKNRVLEWVCKLAIANACVAALLFFAQAVFMLPEIFMQYKVLIFLAMSVIFVIYDIGLSGVIGFLQSRLGRLLK